MKQILRRVLCAALMFALFAVVPAPFARAADESPKLVAFTFDDGPSGQTARLLDGLPLANTRPMNLSGLNWVSS